MVTQEVVKRGFMRLLSEWDKNRSAPVDINWDSMILALFINDEIKRERKAQDLYRREELIPM